MRTVVARSAGFCGGVRRAIAMAEALAARSDSAGIWTDGPLIHNSGETARLAAMRVRVCRDPAALPPGSHLVVRAHGIPPQRLEALSALPLRLSDATCPFVRSIQERCRAEAGRGRFVIVLGDEGHAEVIGLVGHAGPRSAVVSGPEGIRSLPEPGAPVSLVSQSTHSPESFAETAAEARSRWADVRVFDTICPATRERRAGLEALLGECDAVAVVGSPQSANTARLLAFAGSRRPARLVESPETLDEDFFRAFSVVGIAAGASTPDATINAVRARLEALQ